MDRTPIKNATPGGRAPLNVRSPQMNFHDALGCLGSLLWRGKIGPAFWTIASVASLAINLVLLAILLILGRQLFTLKSLVGEQLVAGLHANFVKMDAARITTSVTVNDTIPVVFDLPVQTNTMVTLIEDTRIKNATVNLSTGGLSIHGAPANIVLPAGTQLPIALSIVVPVSTTVPVQLTVPVDIPLNQTELHEPFVGLQNVISPYNALLTSLPSSWQETPLCQPGLEYLCNWFTENQ